MHLMVAADAIDSLLDALAANGHKTVAESFRALKKAAQRVDGYDVAEALKRGQLTLNEEANAVRSRHAYPKSFFLFNLLCHCSRATYHMPCELY